MISVTASYEEIFVPSLNVVHFGLQGEPGNRGREGDPGSDGNEVRCILRGDSVTGTGNKRFCLTIAYCTSFSD